MECTTGGCEAPTNGLYLCNDCIRDLDAWIAKAHDLLTVIDITIQKRDVTRLAGQEGGGGVGGGKSAPPMNVDAWQLKLNMQSIDRTAAKYAEDKFAAGIATTIQDWVTKAEREIDLPTELIHYGYCECATPLKAAPEATSVRCPNCQAFYTTKELREKLKTQVRGQPMPPREAREYVRRHVNAYISKKDFENWVQHRTLPYVLERVTTTGRPKRLYCPGDLIRTYHERRNTRRMEKSVLH